MEFFKKYMPYILAIAAFIILAYSFSPQVFEGKVVNQSDIASWRGMANEIISYNESHPGEDPALWTNSMFSGMPATSISVVYQGDFTDYIYKALLLGVRPPSYLLISMIGAFLMFLAFGANVYVSFIGAIAVSFCSYNFQIIQVGHNSKMVAIAFMPWVIAAIAYAYKRRAILGSLLFALVLSFQIKANHPQITYYLAIIVLGYALARLYESFKEKTLPKFFMTSALLLVAGGIGIATNINHLWPTYEYSKYTMRGGSELTKIKSGNEEGGGLDIAYATQWSYGFSELPNLFIPNYNGGSSSGELSTESSTYNVLKSANYQGAEQVIKQMPLYWGPQPFTAGPMYIGAISVFLFVLGLALVKGALKWWIAGVSLISILLSLGYHFLPATELFFKYAPMYSKFRTVSMILVVLQILVPLLAFLALDRFFKEELDQKRAKKGLITAAAVSGGFALVMLLMPSFAGNFTSPNDSQLPEQIASALVSDRMDLLTSDALRSLIFVMLAAAALWFTLLGKLKKSYTLVIIGALVIADLWGAGKRYLNDEHFVNKTDFNNQYALRPVDNEILKDKNLSYRVLDVSINTFNDAHVSFHHKTIGGYSPVKMQRYQDMIDYHISPEMQQISKDINGSKTVEEAQSRIGNYPVLNMLNTKYIVVGGDYPPLVNSRAFGNAWFVDSVVIVKDALEEIESLSKYNLERVAVSDSKFSNIFEGKYNKRRDVEKISASDSTSAKSDTIALTQYSPNKLKYKTKSARERVAVFSEVYYPAGWSATIDGKSADIFRVNYILRALVVPAGEHEIEFTYSPDSIRKGATYSRISSGLLLLLLISAIGAEVLNRRKRAVKE